MSLKPITREEMFLAKAGGEDVGELKPITRREKFLDRIAGGGGADLPFGEKEKALIDNKTYSYSADDGGYLIDTLDIQNGETYKVVYNGVETICQGLSEDGISTIGNLFLLYPEFAPDTGESFLIVNVGMTIFIPRDGSTEDITLSVIGKEVTKIPEKYYLTKKTFYYGMSDKYLYHGIDCLQKVTMEEFNEWHMKYPVYISASYQNTPLYRRPVLFVCYAAEGGTDESKGYAVYVPSNWLAYPNQYDIYYTAEYTE